jgi:type VI secretion system protein ImpH
VTAFARIEVADADLAGNLKGAASRPGVVEDLLASPADFSFDAAVAVMMQAVGSAEPGDAVQLRATAGLGFPGADVLEVTKAADRFEATTALLGLTGPGGVLPRFYTELATGERRRRSKALGAFLDMLAQRPLAQFAQAPVKYRPALIASAAHASRREATGELSDGLRHVLLALTGHAAPEMAGRQGETTEALLFYAGLFAVRPRAADRLQALLSDWLGTRVRVDQFAGHWARLAPDARSALPAAGKPGQFNRLGIDAAAGARCWDIQSRIEIRIGPVDLPGFQSLLPNGALLPRLQALVARYLDGETGFAVRPVLAAASVPPLRLEGETAGAPRLGWNCWLPTAGPRTQDAADVCFTDEGRP